MNTTIGAVIIGRHEEALLPRCLESVKGLDEIAFCFTGDLDDKTDGTLKIAKKYTKNISYFKWCDSFCKARNAVKSHAESDWLLSIDCDEILHDVGVVREAVALAEAREVLAVDCRLIAEDKPPQYFAFPRLFKNDSRVWWNGNVHNHLSVLGETLGNVRITHGYSPAHALDPDRSFRILKKEVETNPDAVREMFYLGREYFYRADYENCVIMLGKYVQRGRWLSEKAEAFLTMSMAYFSMGMGEDARDACLQAVKLNPNFKEAVLYMATVSGDGRGNDRWQKNADQWRKMAETADNSDVLFVREP